MGRNQLEMAAHLYLYVGDTISAYVHGGTNGLQRVATSSLPSLLSAVLTNTKMNPSTVMCCAHEKRTRITAAKAGDEATLHTCNCKWPLRLPQFLSRTMRTKLHLLADMHSFFNAGFTATACTKQPCMYLCVCC